MPFNELHIFCSLSCILGVAIVRLCARKVGSSTLQSTQEVIELVRSVANSTLNFCFSECVCYFKMTTSLCSPPGMCSFTAVGDVGPEYSLSL